MTLYVKPISAYLTRDTEMFSRMDPYVTIIVGTEKQRSKTDNEAGTKPKWKDEFIFRGKAKSMTITVFDEDVMTDDLIGSANVQLQKYYDNPTQQQQNIKLLYKGKDAGTIKLKIKYVTSSQNQNSQNFNQNIQQYNQPFVPQVQPYVEPMRPIQPMQPVQPFQNGVEHQINNQIFGLIQSSNNPYGNQQPQQGNQFYSNILQMAMNQNLNNQNKNTGWGNNQNNGWGPSQNNNGWGNNQPNSGWNNQPNNGWNNQPNSGWGNPNTNNNNNNNNWGNQNNGWKNQNSGW